MEIGVCTFPTHDAMPPDALARMVEERGQESLFYPDHTHIPAKRETPWPAGGELPPWYWRIYDLFIALTAAATATTRLRVGSGICLVAERDPIITAKEVASLDRLSGGRFDFGIGAGWNQEEMRNHGVDPAKRFAIVREYVEAMKAIWSQDEASYQGEHVSFDAILSWPKPQQRPHPPILLGGDGPKVLDRAAAYGGAWFPHWKVKWTQEGVIDPRLAEARERGLEVQVMGVPADPAALEQLRAVGVTRALHWLPSAGRAPIERVLERWETAVTDYRGA